MAGRALERRPQSRPNWRRRQRRHDADGRPGRARWRRHPQVVHSDVDALARRSGRRRIPVGARPRPRSPASATWTRGWPSAHTVRTSHAVAVESWSGAAATAAGTAAEVHERVDQQTVARAGLLDEHQRMCPARPRRSRWPSPEHERVRLAAVEVRDALTAAAEAESDATRRPRPRREKRWTLNGFESVEAATRRGSAQPGPRRAAAPATRPGAAAGGSGGDAGRSRGGGGLAEPDGRRRGRHRDGGRRADGAAHGLSTRRREPRPRCGPSGRSGSRCWRGWRAIGPLATRSAQVGGAARTRRRASAARTRCGCG